jgi:hypothetical protein
MAAAPDAIFAEFCARLRELMAPYRGKVEYGDLREQIDTWESSDGTKTSNVAIVYETPGGSTDQINVSFHHATSQFSLIADEAETVGEYLTGSIPDVLEQICPRIVGIPEKRREHLRTEIRRKLEAGESPMSLVGHLNRLLTSEFKGGRVTHLELRDAMTFAVKYSKDPALPR